MGIMESVMEINRFVNDLVDHDVDFRTGRIFWYLDMLNYGRNFLAQEILSFWPEYGDRKFIQETRETLDQRLSDFGKLLQEFLASMNQAHATFEGDLRAKHILGDEEAFTDPDIIIILGCVDKAETDARVAQAVAYERALQNRGAVILTSGRGFWQRAAAEAELTFEPGKHVNKQFHYPELSDRTEWLGVPTEAGYMTRKLR